MNYNIDMDWFKEKHPDEFYMTTSEDGFGGILMSKFDEFMEVCELILGPYWQKLEKASPLERQELVRKFTKETVENRKMNRWIDWPKSANKGLRKTWKRYLKLAKNPELKWYQKYRGVSFNEFKKLFTGPTLFEERQWNWGEDDSNELLHPDGFKGYREKFGWYIEVWHDTLDELDEQGEIIESSVNPNPSEFYISYLYGFNKNPDAHWKGGEGEYNCWIDQFEFPIPLDPTDTLASKTNWEVVNPLTIYANSDMSIVQNNPHGTNMDDAGLCIAWKIDPAEFVKWWKQEKKSIINWTRNPLEGK